LHVMYVLHVILRHLLLWLALLLEPLHLVDVLLPLEHGGIIHLKRLILSLREMHWLHLRRWGAYACLLLRIVWLVGE